MRTGTVVVDGKTYTLRQVAGREHEVWSIDLDGSEVGQIDVLAPTTNSRGRRAAFGNLLEGNVATVAVAAGIISLDP